MNFAHTIHLADSWSMHGSGAGWWIPMMVLMMLFWAAVIFGIVWLIRGASFGWPGSRREPPEPRRETPTEILERRFAEGAISPEDYRARRDALRSPVESDGASEDESPTARPAGEGRQ